MKIIYIGGKDTNLIYDVSSEDAEVSSTASSTIQIEFGEAAQQLGEMIKKRVYEKRLKIGTVIDSSEHK